MSKKDELPPIDESEISDSVKKARQAAERVAKKLREEKRKLGHKLVVHIDGEMKIIEP